MQKNDETDKILYGGCSWTTEKGFHAWSKYGEVGMFENGGHRATELMLISAASCLGYILARYVDERALPVVDIRVRCGGTLAKRPERMARITTEVVVEGAISDAERKKMLMVCERACKVMNTLKYQPTIETILKTPTGETIA